MSDAWNFRPLGQAHPFRSIGISDAKGHEHLQKSTSHQQKYIRSSPFAPSVPIMNSGLADIDNYMLPGGIPVGSILGIFSPDPWLDMPPSHVLPSTYDVNNGGAHRISNIIAVAFAAYGVLIEDSALLVITGLPSLKGPQATSISTCFSSWPSISIQDAVPETRVEEKRIPMKIAWRYNTTTFKSSSPTSTVITTSPGDLDKDKLCSLDWTSSINSSKHLLEKVQDKMHVISLAHHKSIDEIVLAIEKFFRFLSGSHIKTARIVMEDPLSVYSSISKPEHLVPIFKCIRRYKNISLSIIFLSPIRHNSSEYLLRVCDGYVELTDCPKELIPKQIISPSSDALMCWKKPFRLPNLAFWSPPVSTGGVWQVSLNRRKAIVLVPVSFPVADDREGDAQNISTCSPSDNINW